MLGNPPAGFNDELLADALSMAQRARSVKRSPADRIPPRGGDTGMRLIKIGLGNVNPTVGEVRSNVERLLAQARAMAAGGVTVGCFPEQAVGGYPTEDRMLWRWFIADQ